MKFIPIALIIFGVVVMIEPEILAYLIGGLFIFLGVNGLVLGGLFSKMKKGGNNPKDSYVKFGDYKIFR